MEIFFIISFVGLVIIALYKGGVALFGKGIMVLAILALFIYMCSSISSEYDKFDKEQEEFRIKSDEWSNEIKRKKIKMNMEKYGMPDPPETQEELERARQFRKAHGYSD